ncbi:hypothetical protein OIB37_18410 [Streptomyces sp. NBC_00820]|uniref:hypothetical protein n=1 Tax=Streptomyces sp. NBC_00820 TaxID=2975842 RepID=UPI002ED559BD|nr:hypothetical protein OIB37_18410 [Streptomyces sp. NBC_00820]
MSTARTRPPRHRAWLRLLVLLLALLVPGAHAQAQAAPALTASAEPAEHDALDTLVRPPARALHQADAPERATPLPGQAPAGTAAHPRPRAFGAPGAPFALPLLRTVVLRC